MPKPVLTFIHGFMGHPSDWDQIRNLLPQFETHALEIGVAEDWQSSLNLLAANLPSRSIVVGYSMGARLALGLALEFPRKVSGLIFISGNPGLESKQDRQQRWQADQKVAARIATESVDQFLESWYRSDVFATVPAPVRRAEIERKRRRCSDLWPAILLANSVSNQPNYWPHLASLEVPALFVAGQRDEKYRQIALRIAEECSPVNVETKIVTQSGHIIHREQPDQLAKLIHRFGFAHQHE